MPFSIRDPEEDRKNQKQGTQTNSQDSEEQLLQQETRLLLEKQTEKIQSLENQLAGLEREREERDDVHQRQVLGLREQIREAEAQIDQTISNAERLRAEDREKHKEEIANVKQRAAVLRNHLRAVGWYSILVTLLAIVFSRSFQAACWKFWAVIQSNVVPAVCLALGTPARIAHLADGIPDKVWSSVIYWAALLWLSGAAIEIVYGCGWLIRRSGKFYRAHMADSISLAVALTSMAIAIFFAGPLRTIGINAILIILIVNAGYTVWRSMRIVHAGRKSRTPS